MIDMQNDFNLKLGNTLKRLRRLAGLSQEELADRAKVSQQTISKLENHAVEPRRRTMISLANVLADLGISRKDIDTLFEQAGMSASLQVDVNKGDWEINPAKIPLTESLTGSHDGSVLTLSNDPSFDFDKRKPVGAAKKKLLHSYATEKASLCMKLMLEIADEDPKLLEFLRTNLDLLQARAE